MPWKTFTLILCFVCIFIFKFSVNTWQTDGWTSNIRNAVYSDDRIIMTIITDLTATKLLSRSCARPNTSNRIAVCCPLLLSTLFSSGNKAVFCRPKLKLIKSVEHNNLYVSHSACTKHFYWLSAIVWCASVRPWLASKFAMSQQAIGRIATPAPINWQLLAEVLLTRPATVCN